MIRRARLGSDHNTEVLRRALTTVIIATIAASVLAGCRLDLAVDVAMDSAGTGTVTVTATADAELVAQLPELAQQLAVDDLSTWTVEGPRPTADGGLEVVLQTAFSSPEELAGALNSIGPPFTEMAAGRSVEGDNTVSALRGRFVVTDGLASFADPELIELAGDIPFRDRLEAAQVPLDQALGVTLTVALPGEALETNGVAIEPGVYRWTAPMDGTIAEIDLLSLERAAPIPGWARPLSTVTFLLLMIWIVLSALFVVFVITGRQRRRQRRRRAAAAARR